MINFYIKLAADKYASLRHQFGIITRGEHSKYLPSAFTEHGMQRSFSAPGKRLASEEPGNYIGYINLHMESIVSTRSGGRMVFHHVWDHVFSTWSHVAVLRALMDSAQGATGRELARQSGMNHRACLQALTELEALSIIHRVRGGRDHFFTLNRDHVLVEQGILPLLSVERSFSRSVFTYLADRLAKRVRSLIVFGSVARKEELPSSDLDLCLVVRNENEIAAAEAAAHAIAPEVLNRFGAKLAPLVLTQKEFIRRTKRKIPPVQDIVNEGVVIGGLSMKGLVNGKA